MTCHNVTLHCEANRLNSKGEVNVSDIPGPLLQSGVSHAMFLSKFVLIIFIVM